MSLVKNNNLQSNNKFNQYFTNEKISSFMAKLLPKYTKRKRITILDPGAGRGILSITLINEILNNQQEIRNIKLISYEIDTSLIEELESNYKELSKRAFNDFNVRINYTIVNKNYLYSLHESIYADIVIMNPPYEKMKKSSNISNFLEKNSISNTNYYSSFVEVSLKHLKNKGTLITIIPRSFMNGRYFTKFRQNVFERNTLCHIHLFESRNLFRNVIQENVILSIVKSLPFSTNKIKISYSFNDDFDELKYNTKLLDEVVDKVNGGIIRLSNNEDSLITNIIEANGKKLSELNLEVSTGPIVDFRDAKNLIHYEDGPERVPFIFSEHVTENSELIFWPRDVYKKGNFIELKKSLISKMRTKGNYVVVRRFSPKESKKWIYCSVFYENPEYKWVGFDNKLNYYHRNKGGLEENLAMGLCLYMNSSLAEIYLKQITGNTQINSSDLEILKYPSVEEMKRMGEEWKTSQLSFTKVEINRVVASHLKNWK